MRTPEDPCRDPASEARDDHASEPRATPETDYAAWGETDVVEAAFARRLERQRDELTDRWEKSANAFLIEQGKREAAERQRDGLLEALELWGLVDDEFTTHGVNPVFASLRNAAIEKHRATIAAVKGGRDE
jgi:hypothetical protein